MAVEWKVALPLHPEYRTLPMVWYVPPLSPIQNAAASGALEVDGELVWRYGPSIVVRMRRA